jgi:hypothetical protein
MDNVTMVSPHITLPNTHSITQNIRTTCLRGLFTSQTSIYEVGLSSEYFTTMHLHNIIQIQDNVLWDWQYPRNIPHNQFERGEYFVEYCQSVMDLNNVMYTHLLF